MSYGYSGRYQQLNTAVPCPLCGTETFEGQPCSVCLLPLKVIESIRVRPEPPRFVGVLGPSGVGKTVYLGMLLDLLARGVGGMRGIAQSPFSMTLHRNLILALERQRFPEKTPVESDRWQWVHCEVHVGKSKAPFHIVTPDVAGEAVMSELDYPGSNKTIRALMVNCAALVILIDVACVIADGQGQELFAMQVVSYLDNLRPRRRNRKIAVPVAIVFTKTDLCDDWINDPDEFAKANVSELYGQCETRLEHFSFYFAGVAGSTGRLVDRGGQEMLVPLRVEPRGVIEPFAWLVKALG